MVFGTAVCSNGMLITMCRSKSIPISIRVISNSRNRLMQRLRAKIGSQPSIACIEILSVIHRQPRGHCCFGTNYSPKRLTPICPKCSRCWLLIHLVNEEDFCSGPSEKRGSARRRVDRCSGKERFTATNFDIIVSPFRNLCRISFCICKV